MIDILYVAYNCQDFTRMSLEALLKNTNWKEVRKLYVHDDGSTDGTAVYLRATLADYCPVEYDFQCVRLGGPVAAMNAYLDKHAEERADTETFAKIDNDFVVCPGWLDEMLHVMWLKPGVDVLGMEPFVGDVTAPPLRTRDITECEHIGGKGLIRLRAFRNCRMRADGRNGFTGWQTSHPDVTKAWVTPDLPCFGIDQLPIVKFQELSEYYAEMGWHRTWPPYAVASHDYWDWFCDMDGNLR